MTLPLLDGLLSQGLTPEGLLELSRKLRRPLAELWGVVRFYPRYQGEKEGRYLVDDPVARARGFPSFLQEADGTHPPLGLEALAPVFLRRIQGQTLVETPQGLVPLSDHTLPFALAHGNRLLPPEPLLELRDYEAWGGLSQLRALMKGALTEGGILQAVEEAGLLGRGGAAFATARKMRQVASAQGEKYLVVNADESEPGNFKDRFLLEHHPFLVLEGALLAGKAVGAKQVYLYVRSEFEAAIRRLESAIGTLEKAGLLLLPMEVFRSGGLYICGEETALLESMEGRRAEPRLKPPYPTEKGLFGRPTLVNNVETLASLPVLLKEGRAWREAEPKLFSISGDVERPGLYELPLGTPLEVALRRAGGAPETLKAVLLGGAAGVFVKDFSLPLHYRGPRPIGAGAVVAYHKDRDLFQVMEGLAAFFAHESCGKCFPCALGTQVQLSLVRERVRDQALVNDLEAALKGSLCGLGQSAYWAYKSLLEVDGAA